MFSMMSINLCPALSTSCGGLQGSAQRQPEANFPPMQPADAVRYQSMFQQMDNDRDGYVQVCRVSPLTRQHQPQSQGIHALHSIFTLMLMV